MVVSVKSKGFRKEQLGSLRGASSASDDVGTFLIAVASSTARRNVNGRDKIKGRRSYTEYIKVFLELVINIICMNRRMEMDN